MCLASADTPQYAAHRPLQPGYAEHRCRAIGTRNKEHLGKLIELLLPLITRHYNIYMKSTGYKSFSNRRMLRIDIGIESPGDFSHLLFEHFEVEQFKRLATYDEMLLVTDFKRESSGSSGFASFCRQLLNGSRSEARFVSERLSARAISLCELTLNKTIGAPPMEHSLQKSLLALLNDIASSSDLPALSTEVYETGVFSRIHQKARAGMSDEQRYRQNWRVLKTLFWKTFSSHPPAFDKPITTKSVAIEQFGAQLYTLSDTTRTFFESHLDANTRDALQSYTASPGVRSSLAPIVLCREINELLAAGKLRRADCFRPHAIENAYNAGIEKHVESCTEPSVRQRLQLHFNRSLLESAFRTEIIDSRSKFEKWVSIQLNIITRTLTGRLSQAHNKKQPVSLDDFDQSVSLTAEDATNPFIKVRNMITSFLDDEVQIRVMLYKFVDYFGNEQIAERMEKLHPDLSPWHRKKVANILDAALQNMRRSMKSTQSLSTASNSRNKQARTGTPSQKRLKDYAREVSAWNAEQHS